MGASEQGKADLQLIATLHFLLGNILTDDVMDAYFNVEDTTSVEV